MKSKRFSLGSSLVATLLVVASATAISTTASSAASKTPIKLGLIASYTGAFAGAHENAPQAIVARIKWQNAHGGINGRQIKLVTEDDQSSPTVNLSAAKSLASQGVIAIMESSALDTGGAPYLLSQNIAVGSNSQGPEVGQYRNFFGSSGSLSSSYPSISVWGQFLKSQGASSFAGLGYGAYPSSIGEVTGWVGAAKAAGINAPYVNTTLAIPVADWSPICLAMKADNIDSVGASLASSDILAMLAACQQIGLTFKATIFPSGFGPSSLGAGLANTEAQGTEYSVPYVPAIVKKTATQTMLKAFSKYRVGYAGYDAETGWLSADIVIYGLEHAKGSIARKSVLTALKSTTAYTGGGLEITPVNFKTEFGVGSVGSGPAPRYCDYFVRLSGQAFKLISNKPICGSVVK
jgi:ABC-type branched-subunit amino acid transport system substrate-binding protein